MSIDFFTFALPLIKHSNNDISDVTGTASDFIANKVGLKTRYILGKEETSVSLAVDACEKLFLQVKCNREDIDLLVCVTQNPDHKIPHNAGIIADKLGLSNSLLSFDLSLGCSGYVYGVQVVDSMLKSMGLKNAILVTSDPYSRIIAEENKDTSQEEQIPGEQPVQISQKAQDWATKNEWFGSDRVMTQAAMAIDEELRGQGVASDSDEYYNNVNKRMKEYFPQKFAQDSTDKEPATKQPVQNVAGVSRRQGGRKSVKLTKSQVVIAKKLGVPLEEYAKFVKGGN